MLDWKSELKQPVILHLLNANHITELVMWQFWWHNWNKGCSSVLTAHTEEKQRSRSSLQLLVCPEYTINQPFNGNMDLVSSVVMMWQLLSAAECVDFQVNCIESTWEESLSFINVNESHRVMILQTGAEENRTELPINWKAAAAVDLQPLGFLIRNWHPGNNCSVNWRLRPSLQSNGMLNKICLEQSGPMVNKTQVKGGGGGGGGATYVFKVRRCRRNDALRDSIFLYSTCSYCT